MEWYADRLAVFYGGKNVPKSAVQAARRKTFAEATRIEARAADPEIRLTPDDLGATMIFKETYRFTGPRINRRGTALQELTWRKTGDGWRIVGERTLRDVPPTARPSARSARANAAPARSARREAP